MRISSLPRPAALLAAGLVPVLLGSVVATAAWADDAPTVDPPTIAQAAIHHPPVEFPAEPDEPMLVHTPAAELEAPALEAAAPHTAALEPVEPAPVDPAPVDPVERPIDSRESAQSDAPAATVTTPSARVAAPKAGDVDLVSPAIPPGASRDIPITVPVDTTELMVLVVGDHEVEPRLIDPQGRSHPLVRANMRDYVFLIDPPAGEWTLRLTNTGDASHTVNYETAIKRADIQFSISANVGRPELALQAIPTVGGAFLPGLDIQVRVTGPGGVITTQSMVERASNYTATYLGLPYGNYTVYAWFVRDGVTYESGTTGRVAALETTPPVVEYTTEPAASNAAGWFARDVTVRLNSSDSGSGPWSITYVLDGAEPRTVFTNALTLTLRDGEHELTYSARDAQGNESLPHTRTIRVDTGLPTLSVITPAQGATYAPGETVVADYACEDSRSGIRDCAAPVADGEELDTSVEGVHSFRVVATDRAGNLTERTVNYRVGEPDTEAPSVSAQVPDPGAGGWFREPVTIVVNATDAGSGVERIAWHADRGAGSAAGDQAEVTVSTPGIHEVEYWAIDREGNVSERVRVTVRVDLAEPVIEIRSPEPLGASLAPLEPGQVRQGSTVLADFECADEASGVATCEGSTDDGEALPTSQLGVQRFSVVATDVAGHRVEEVVEYEVVAAPAAGGQTPPRPSGALAATGLEIVPLLALAAVLIAAGTLLAVRRLARR